MSDERKPFVKPKKVGGGMMFKNFRKRKPNDPDGTGNLEVNGVKYDIAAWIKPLKKGNGTFYSLSITEPKPKTNGLPTEEESREQKSESRNVPGESPSPTGSAEHEPVPEPQTDGDGIIV